MGYSRIDRQTRNDERYRAWPRNRRQVWEYLLCNPHQDKLGGRVGCYVVSPAYIADDLMAPDWTPSISEIADELEALQAEQRIAWDPAKRLVLLCNHFAHNQPENPNVVTASVRDIQELPYSETVFERFLAVAAELLPETFDKGKPCAGPILDAIRARIAQHNALNGSETVREPLGQQFRNPSPFPLPLPVPKEQSSVSTKPAPSAAPKEHSEASRLMGIVRSRLYLDGGPPAPRTEAQDASTLSCMLAAGIPGPDIERMIEAVAAFRDDGQITKAPAGTPVSMGLIYYRPKGQKAHQTRPLVNRALEYLDAKLAAESTDQPRETRAPSEPTPLGDLSAYIPTKESGSNAA